MARAGFLFPWGVDAVNLIRNISAFGATIFILTLSLATAAFAQEGERSDEGKLTPYTPCAIDLVELSALPEFLTRAALEEIRINRKLLRGYYEESAGDRDSLSENFPMLKSGARQLIRLVQDNLKMLDSTRRTAALLYSVPSNGGDGSVLCVWFVTTQDTMLVTTRKEVPLARFIQDRLGVTARAAVRAPIRRDGRPVVGEIGPVELTPERKREALEQTAEVMLPPAIRGKIESQQIRRVLIFAQDDLGTVPFAALPMGDDRLLADVASILILPNISQLLEPWPSRPNLSGEKLVVGDPDFSTNKTWILQDLPAAKAEAVEVAEMFGSPVLVGKSATRRAIMRKLDTPTIGLAYFATHGVADGVNPMDGSFLALAGDLLYGRDIKNLKLKSGPLVVMSACQTGLGKVFPGGMFGLARAWFFAGAPQVVMSLWDLDDEATKLLMVKLMTKVAAQEPIELAMQEAMRETKSVFPDPALWAGFAVYGQPTRF